MGFLNIGRAGVSPANQQTISKLEGEIARGVKDGTLTSGESQKLYRDLDQLKQQMARPVATGGLFGGVAGAVKQAHVNAAAANLEKNINSQRANGEVDFAKLRNSNIGATAQRIGQFEQLINLGAQSGKLTPKEQNFLKTQLNAIKETFANAIKGDGKLDAGEEAQLSNMQRDLLRDTFAAVTNNDRRNPFTQYQPPTSGDQTMRTMAMPEEGSRLNVVTKAIPE